jgi:hypothetical protein
MPVKPVVADFEQLTAPAVCNIVDVVFGKHLMKTGTSTVCRFGDASYDPAAIERDDDSQPGLRIRPFCGASDNSRMAWIIEQTRG